ncbi:DgyrCDS6500 [Dimorphilus gyrociliatus]|uniref:Polyprenal reductase n=1 Tax=Dimorphilus gyrociliatus TaxID=2664684 RepID=A0A7I8VR06_9ANNE|nr:DgyrCDS6500 [Dimorphilus gyrociliatus]
MHIVAQMEDFLKSDNSLLNQFLLTLILLRLLYFLASFVLARNPKPNDDKLPDDVKVLFFQFRKRVAPIFFFMFLSTIWFAWTAYASFCRDGKTTGYTHSLLERVLHPKRSASVDTTSIFLAYFLFFMHVTRRLNEGLRVSIFSHRQVMSFPAMIVQYIIGLAIAISILADGPNLEEAIEGRCFGIDHLLNYKTIVAIVMFTTASIIQNHCFKNFVQLRKNKSGHCVTTGYKLPKGGFFDYISSPQLLAELVIYISIGLILNGPTWWLVVAGVAIKEYDAAYHCHEYYKSKFAKDMPSSRKAFIPFLT